MTGETIDAEGERAGSRLGRLPVLEVDDLTVTLGGQRIIEHLSFIVQRGEILTILGPNGAGKTILLRALLGVLPYEGRIAWAKGVRIGYVPQRLPYIKDVPMSVEEFFALKKSERRRGSIAAAREMLSAVGLGDEFRKKRIGDLSSGQFQRVLIAWALAGEPDVLLFDEPTTGVDIGGEETEALTAIVFSSSVAAAFLFLPMEQAETALVGDLAKAGPGDTAVSVAASLFIIVAAKRSYPALALINISEDLATSEGLHVRRMNCSICC